MRLKRLLDLIKGRHACPLDPNEVAMLEGEVYCFRKGF